MLRFNSQCSIYSPDSIQGWFSGVILRLWNFRFLNLQKMLSYNLDCSKVCSCVSVSRLLYSYNLHIFGCIHSFKFCIFFDGLFAQWCSCRQFFLCRYLLSAWGWTVDIDLWRWLGGAQKNNGRMYNLAFGTVVSCFTYMCCRYADLLMWWRIKILQSSHVGRSDRRPQLNVVDGKQSTTF